MRWSWVLWVVAFGGCDDGAEERASDRAPLDARLGDGPRSDAAPPDSAHADRGPTDAALADGLVPDAALLDGAPPDLTLPDLALPDGAPPDLALPDLALPDLALPDLALPDGAPPDLALPDGAPPDLALPDLDLRPEDCVNGVDDDGDGLTDCADPDCVGFFACERLEICDSGRDDDGDGATDCADPDCADFPGCAPYEARCADGDDDDHDGLIDCADPDCCGAPACAEDPGCLAPPPDPAAVAPAADPTRATHITDLTRFLYEGPVLVQRGVRPGAIRSDQAARLSGVVRDAAGDPLPGVRVAVHGRPELGMTVSRADGRWDLAVAGSPRLVVDFQRAGLLPAQRQVSVGWRHSRGVADVVLLPLDPTANPVLADAADWQLAQGSPQADAEGARQATLLVPPGVQARMVLPDGAVEVLDSLTVRATEYTVGTPGPAAMPGALPVMSGYTYAVELSVDEAQAAGAVAVEFDAPLWLYVENFVGFPVGATVPAGAYDRAQAAWLPSDDGRVIAVLGVDGDGLALLDTDGDGIPDDALGVAPGERALLAARYPAGTELWRTPVEHFTPWDCNWPFGPPVGATAPPSQPVRPERGRRRPWDPCQRRGSLIDCRLQGVGEQIPLAGTPFALVYRSERVWDYAPNRTLRARLYEPAQLHPELVAVRFEVDLAGRTERWRWAADALPDPDFAWEWDGLDSEGRPVFGDVVADVRVGFVYRAQFYESRADFNRALGAAGVSRYVAVRSRSEVELWQDHVVYFGSPAAAFLAPGWTLSVHHLLDQSGRVQQGDGQVVDGPALALGGLTRLVGGQGTGQALARDWDGVDALEARLAPTRRLAVDAGGRLHFGMSGGVYRVEANGRLSRVAGGGRPADGLGDGLPARQAVVDPEGLAFGPDGSLFIADIGSGRVRRVDPAGIIHTVAGGGAPADGYGDGLQATEAALTGLRDLAVARDGSLYLGCAGPDGLGRVRIVSPGGLIRTLAGGGDPADGLGAGGQARQARFRVEALALAPDGTVIIGDLLGRRVLQVTPDGVLEHLAGSGAAFALEVPDGARARDVPIRPVGLAVEADGSVLIADDIVGLPDAIHAVRGGQLYRVTGWGSEILSIHGPEAPPRRSLLRTARGVAVGPDGRIYFNDAITGGSLLRVDLDDSHGFTTERWQPGIRRLGADGRHLHGFDRRGRHTATLDAYSGVTTLRFEHDAQGRLVAVVDGAGRRTTLRHGGDEITVESPDGLETTLRLDDRGRLAAVEAPDGSRHAFAWHGEGGLLARTTHPTGATSDYRYDAAGRLVEATGQTGVRLQLARSGPPEDFSVEVQLGDAPATAFGERRLVDGTLERWSREPSGETTRLRLFADGRRRSDQGDGGHLEAIVGSDPRLGTQASVAGTIRVQPALGPAVELALARTSELADPADLFAVRSLTESLTLRGRTATWRFDRPAREITIESLAGRPTTAALDGAGRPVEVIRGDERLALSYDAQGRPTGLVRGDEATRFRHAPGETEVLSPTGQRSVLRFDAFDRLVEVALPGERILSLERDAAGSPAALVLPGGGRLSYVHDGYGRLSRAQLPGAASPWQLLRDGADRVVAVDRFGAETVDFAYDPEGRLAELSGPGLETRFSYPAGSAQPAVVVREGPEGAAETLRTTWSGRAAQRLEHPEAGLTVDARFDGLGALSHLTVALGALLEEHAVERDPDGLLVRLGPVLITRDAAGRVTEAAVDDAVTTWTYDAAGRPLSRILSVGGAEIGAVRLARDLDGRVVERTLERGGAVETWRASHDATGALRAVARDGVELGRWEFDLDGNRTATQDAAGPRIDRYDAAGRLLALGADPVDSGPGGRMLTLGPVDLVWAGTGELLAMRWPDGSAVGSRYDGYGRLVARSDRAGGETRYSYALPDAPLTVTHVVPPDGVPISLHRAPDGSLLAYDRAGVRRLVLCDQVGTPVAIYDPAGALLAAVDHDPWGVRDGPLPEHLPVGFGGGLYTADAGLVRLGVRDYLPRAGRFLSADPAGLHGEPLHRLSYARNDPVTFADPLGLFSIGISAYEGVGGGVSLHATGEGLGLCAEGGFGLGTQLSVDPFADLPDEGLALAVSAQAGVGPLHVGFELVGDDCGTHGGPQRWRYGGRGGVGPLSLGFGNLDGEVDTSLRVGGRVGDRNKPIRQLLRRTGYSAQARVALRRCFVYRF